MLPDHTQAVTAKVHLTRNLTSNDLTRQYDDVVLQLSKERAKKESQTDVSVSKLHAKINALQVRALELICANVHT